MRRGRMVLPLSVVGIAALVAGGLAVRYYRPTVEPPAWANEYDVSALSPETIAPGTVVDRTAPAGWSHLIIKSVPRVRPSEVENVPSVPIIGRDETVRMVAWMFTAFAADVVKERQGEHERYRLRAIGLGLGSSANGRDVVVTSETAEQFGVKFGWVKRRVLDTGYRIQKQAIIPVHGPSFALVDTPVTVRCGAKHQPIRYRYAILLDAKTGALDVLVWQLPDEKGECGDITRAAWLEPNCIDEAEMVPNLDEFKSGIPSDIAFAVDKLPPHRLQIPFPQGLRDLVAKTKFTPDDARTLEDGLRNMLAQARP